jgi:hypothetical protein
VTTRRDSRVTKLFNVPVSVDCWRNLAEPIRRSVLILADHPFQPHLSLTSWPSDLGAQRPGVPRCQRGPDIPERRSEKKRQAADPRVRRQREPRRDGHGDCDSQCRQANRRRQKHVSSKHVLPPPREVPDQGAVSAWQDCGPAWVNLRQVAKLPHRDETATVRRQEGLTKARSGKQSLQSWVAAARQNREKFRKILKIHDKIKGSTGLERCGAVTMRVSRSGGGAGAAIWHKAGGPVRPVTPDVTEDCLSFVMPRQQSAQVAAIEDSN